MFNTTVAIIYFAGITAVVGLSLMGRINLGLLFLVPLFPLRIVVEQMHLFPFGKDLINIILLAMILGWFYKASSSRQKLIEPTPLNGVLAFMMIYTYLSLWKGSSFLGYSAPVHFDDPRLQDWKNYMILPLLYFIIVNNIKETKQIKSLVSVMILTMIVMDYYTLGQLKGASGISSREWIHGTFVYLGPNELAAFYAAFSFVLLGIFLWDKAGLRRFLILAVAVVNMYCVLFLYSRGAYIAVLAGLLFITMMQKKFLIIPILLLIIGWQVILPSRVVERINETQIEGSLDTSSLERISIWGAAIDIFKSNPLVGAGFGVVSAMGIGVPGEEFIYRDTHNIYLKILAEQGIVGFVMLLIIFWISLKSGWQLFKNAQDGFLKGLGFGFCCCVVTLMALNFFGDRWTYLEVGTFFWVFLALVARANIITDHENIASYQ
jgi:O-antigen ligase